MEKRYWIHAVTPVHVGSGKGLGYIDMPIAREKVTDWPYIPGSSVKGVIAAHNNAPADTRTDPVHVAAFGTAGSDSGTEAGSYAGALVFTDANIFCLPVRSFYGTFAWVTSPFCLERLGMNIDLHELPGLYQAFVPAESVSAGDDGTIYLEDLDLDSVQSAAAGDFARRISAEIFPDKPQRQSMFAARFVIVSDDVFTFLCKSCTEVNAHIKINPETGTATDGALWYEESLPVETILTGRVWGDKVYAEGSSIGDLFATFCAETLTLQIGGKATTGKGLVRCVFREVN